MSSHNYDLHYDLFPHKYDIFRHKVNLSLWSVVLTSDFVVMRTSIRASNKRDADQMTRDFLTDLYDIRLDEFTTEPTLLLRVEGGE